MKRMKGKHNLKTVPIEYLWEGLVLSEDLYNSSGKVLLIPKGEVLTESRLKQLEKYDPRNRYFTIREDSYNEIVRSGKLPGDIRQKMVEDQSGYTELKKSLNGILSMAHRLKTVSNAEVELTVNDILGKLETMHAETIFQCIDVPRKLDEDLQRHSLNVALLNGMMGEWMEMPPDEIRRLVMAGTLHDIGKARIPEEILNAPRKLTEEETEEIRRHPVYGDAMLGPEVNLKVRQAVRFHHEKMDGSGYPDSLKGDKIPLYARVTSISDIYDAMVSRRSYKEAKIPFDILEQFRENKFEGLDRRLTEIFVKNMRKQFIEKRVEMSDGSCGIVKYIPPNDMEHPVIMAEQQIKQTDDEWYCVRIV